MAFVHGKSAHFEIADVGDVSRDISAYCNSVDFPRTADTAEVSCFGAVAKAYLAGLKDGTITIEGEWDAVVDGYLDGIVGVDAQAFIYGPAGSTAGLVKYSGACICTAYNPPADLTRAVSFTATFQITGVVTRGTF
jgi:hypothetical protein